MLWTEPHRPAVVLDPGHGGHHPAGGSTPWGVRGPGGAWEKDLVLDLAGRLRDRLQARGVPTALTRDRDENLSFGQRVGVAARAGAAAFISLHLGADHPGAPPGPRTFAHTRGGPDSLALAGVVHAACRGALGGGFDPVDTGPLAVLHPDHHHPGTAACLVELTLLSDPAEERRLGDPGLRDDLAERLGDALSSWVSARPDAAPRPPRLRALIVAIDDYGDRAPRLRFARQDALRLAATLVQCLGADPAHTPMLFDADATEANLTARLRALAADAPPGQHLALVFAGRGCASPEAPGALVTADGRGLTPGALRAALADTPVRHLTVLADAGFGTDAAGRGHAGAPLVEGDAQGPQLTWIAAAGPGGSAYEHPSAGGGLFTRALCQRLDASDVEISHEGLVALLSEDLSDQAGALPTPAGQQPWLRTPDPAALLLAPPERGRGAAPFALRHYVPLVAQLAEMSCWAAAAAMLVGWRDCQDMGGIRIAQGSGRWRSWKLGLQPKDIAALAEAWGLTQERPRFYHVAELRGLLERFGPLWLGEADPDLHVVVLTGIRGDGTLDGTEVEINDPWPVGRGERYTLTFRQLAANFHAASRLVGLHAQVLHTGGRPQPSEDAP
ncbi:MAG: N-acetylmuramoyl-L-alanine amidase [Alphaproteobacteria bacterium]|nr:N-acetylmuramoyl-L-alanine amidase [Alphaproteobacteria bacterium]